MSAVLRLRSPGRDAVRHGVAALDLVGDVCSSVEHFIAGTFRRFYVRDERGAVLDAPPPIDPAYCANRRMRAFAARDALRAALAIADRELAAIDSTAPRAVHPLPVSERALNRLAQTIAQSQSTHEAHT